jgi:UDP-N-acetyl-D-mannosaminuronic acid dehydrogenase
MRDIAPTLPCQIDAVVGGVRSDREFNHVVVAGGCGSIGADFVTAIARFFMTSVIDRDAERVSQCRDRWAADPMLHVMEVSDSYKSVRGSDVIVITIGTEGSDGLTRGNLFELFEQLVPLLSESQLIVVRSTASPGSTRHLASMAYALAPSKVDIVVAPERSLEGAVGRELFVIPQLLGGPDRAVDRAERFFAAMGITTIRLPDWESAELAKLICNGYRFMNFQLANHFEMLAAEHSCSYARIRAAIQQDYPRASGLGSSGFVGGPCLPKDTRMLSDANPDGMLDIAASAIALSDEYEMWVARRIERGLAGLRGRRIGVLGMGFKAGSLDRRASRAVWLADYLASRGAIVVEFDQADDVDDVPIDCLVDVFDELSVDCRPRTLDGTACLVYVVGAGWRSNRRPRDE